MCDDFDIKDICNRNPVDCDACASEADNILWAFPMIDDDWCDSVDEEDMAADNMTFTSYSGFEDEFDCAEFNNPPFFLSDEGYFDIK